MRWHQLRDGGVGYRHERRSVFVTHNMVARRKDGFDEYRQDAPTRNAWAAAIEEKRWRRPPVLMNQAAEEANEAITDLATRLRKLGDQVMDARVLWSRR
jgi:hypothetical protein